MIFKHSIIKLCYALAGVVVILIMWQAVAFWTGVPSILPGPGAAVGAAGNLLAKGYGLDLLVTCVRACSAWLLALAVGLPAGLLSGRFQKLYDSSRAILAFFRCMPAYMLITIPIAVGWGGELARIATAAVASAWIIADECAESLQTIPQDRIEVLHALRASHFFIMTRLLWFEALGRIVVPSAKTQIGIIYIVVTVVETLAIPAHGVGARLLTYMSSSEMAPVYGFLMLTGLTGVALNAAVHRLAKTVIFWT